jgi:hypothetical protein
MDLDLVDSLQPSSHSIKDSGKREELLLRTSTSRSIPVLHQTVPTSPRSHNRVWREFGIRTVCFIAGHGLGVALEPMLQGLEARYRRPL